MGLETCDSGTNHLDVIARNAVMEALANFKGSILAVSHDRYFLNKCVNRILEFEDGKLYSYQGNYEAYKTAKGALGRVSEGSTNLVGMFGHHIGANHQAGSIKWPDRVPLSGRTKGKQNPKEPDNA